MEIEISFPRINTHFVTRILYCLSILFSYVCYICLNICLHNILCVEFSDSLFYEQKMCLPPLLLCKSYSWIWVDVLLTFNFLMSFLSRISKLFDHVVNISCKYEYYNYKYRSLHHCVLWINLVSNS